MQHRNYLRYLLFSIPHCFVNSPSFHFADWTSAFVAYTYLTASLIMFPLSGSQFYLPDNNRGFLCVCCVAITSCSLSMSHSHFTHWDSSPVSASLCRRFSVWEHFDSSSWTKSFNKRSIHSVTLHRALGEKKVIDYKQTGTESTEVPHTCPGELIEFF